MLDNAPIALVLGFAFVAANLPFLTERLLIVGPRRSPKSTLWRVAELLVLGAMAVGVGFAVEARQGQRAPQGWEFYVAFGCLFLTFAFPGFVWRYLRRGSGS
jgi:hypothetical protein